MLPARSIGALRAVDATHPSATSGAGVLIDADPLFVRARTAASDLPDPSPLISNLARSVVEVIAGVRDIEQLSRWVTDDVFRHLLIRTQHANRARQARRRPTRRPHFVELSLRVQTTSENIVDAVVILDFGARVRAVTVRLEGLDRRWRASAIHVL
ncbi:MULTISPECIES: Rv3235 family protein [unclassified Pseudoclavibacter]|uniref:Rv3235 family protein n=1 Tax=unclassified Pseudoclavibacter TaxID=2615177 RepID=UPI0012F3A96A|nr:MULTISPECIES: Rv3235 family protein [unclassified Pseudoclavibacter]MBF4460571.1 3-hydroxyacyl-CoA dehydrogenase [Pseudoclavibacter sp. VKM Ac-2867]VXB11594.1 3-hydroxyacyl-CoA dehydrogenase [Pseudoclavibacter sp. 8L]